MYSHGSIELAHGVLREHQARQKTDSKREYSTILWRTKTLKKYFILAYIWLLIWAKDLQQYCRMRGQQIFSLASPMRENTHATKNNAQRKPSIWTSH